MTRLGSSPVVDAPIHQYRYLSECETQYQRDLILEVYRQLFEQFGALPDLVLAQLASTNVEHLNGLRHSLQESTSLEGFAAKVGWVVPQGGEGNYPMDLEYCSPRFSNDEQRLIKERLVSLRQVQRTQDVEVHRASQTYKLDERRYSCSVESDELESPLASAATQFEMTPM